MDDFEAGVGFSCPTYKKETIEKVNACTNEIFKNNLLFLGVGGSIPFMGEFFKIYPESEFFITGMVGPGANIHIPNENFNIAYAIKLF